MKGIQWFNNWRILPRRLGLTGIWSLIALLQTLILVALLVNWPPIFLTLVVPDAEATYWLSLKQEFEAKNPDIRINLIELADPEGDVTSQLRQLCDINLITGTSNCDLIYTDVIWVPEFADKGVLMNLSDRISQSELAPFLTTDVKSGQYQGGLYRIPFRSEVSLLYYRKDLLKQARYEPPQTFQELREISKTLQQRGLAKWGYLWQGRQYEGLIAMFVEVLNGHGAFWINPQTLEVGLDRPEAIAAVRFLIGTIEDKISPQKSYNEAESFAEFQQGNAVFLRNWNDVWIKVNADNSPISGKVGIQPMRLHTETGNGGGCNGSWGLGIAQTSKYPEQAWKAIKYLTSEEAQRQFMQYTSYVPSRKALFKDPKLLKAVENSILRPPIPQYSEASKILQRYLSAAIQKQLSPEQAMKEAAEETRTLLIQ